MSDEPPPQKKRRPDVEDRHGPDAGMSRSEARNAAIREGLTPLAPGERPTPLIVAIVVCVVVALANLVLLVSGYEVPRAGRATGVSTAIFVGALGLLAVGMWMRQYWAVLGMQGLLGITAAYAALSLLVASNATAAILAVTIAVLAGALFYRLVRVMARMQTPRPADSA